MVRNQDGHLFEVKDANGKTVSYHVRYRVTEMKNGKPTRVQKSVKLCDKDDRHHSPTCKAVADKLKKHMAEVNRTNGAESADVLITEFWDNTYLPHIQTTKKAATINGYIKLWKKHLAPAFDAVLMKAMTCAKATIFLTSLVKVNKLGRRSVAHVHSLASGLFRHAKQLGIIESNPFTDAASHVKPKAPQQTHAYSLEEAENIFNALDGNLQAQLIFCLSTFMGLRPGETAALKWSDVDQDFIHIRRAVWRGVVSTTKTAESVSSVPLFSLVRSLLKEWKKQCLPSNEGWIFPNRNGDPIEINSYCHRIIRAALTEKNIVWRGLYSGRRAAGTLLTQLTGDAVAAQYVLRHSNLSTTTAFYVKPIREEAVSGMKLLEEKIGDRFRLPAANSEAVQS